MCNTLKSFASQRKGGQSGTQKRKKVPEEACGVGGAPGRVWAEKCIATGRTGVVVVACIQEENGDLRSREGVETERLLQIPRSLGAGRVTEGETLRALIPSGRAAGTPDAGEGRGLEAEQGLGAGEKAAPLAARRLRALKSHLVSETKIRSRTASGRSSRGALLPHPVDTPRPLLTEQARSALWAPSLVGRPPSRRTGLPNSAPPPARPVTPQHHL